MHEKTPARARFRILPLFAFALVALACATSPPVAPRGFPKAALPIDLERFAGSWYVIAHIPLSAEKNAYAAVENYELLDDGSIDVLFQFCEGDALGPLQEITMEGWVHDSRTNAEWRVRPVWPLRLHYQILELDPEYSFTVVGHRSRDYAWIMARSPAPAAGRVASAIARLTVDGYDVARLRRVPQPATNCRS